MNFFFDIPLEFRTALVFLLGAVLGGQINRGIYQLAWFPRPIDPWSTPHKKATPRTWTDKIPIWGWLSLKREETLHGTGFWVRPMLIELFTAFGFASLYWYQIQGDLLPPPEQGPGADLNAAGVVALLHSQYFSSVILISLMLVATFIDFDEKTIPDAITLPGTLIGLLFAAVFPNSVLAISDLAGSIEPLQLSSPNDWPVWLDGENGFWIGWACLLGWCLAILPKTVTMRRGAIKAIQYMAASIYRHRTWPLLAIIGLTGGVIIFSVWNMGEDHWHSLLSALIGMAFGGGMIWTVRIVGSVTLDKEAMGFGDVTLMAMIGAFLGWQSTLIIFFFSPFAALFIAVAQWLFSGRKDIAFGPYLCLNALLLILFWGSIWTNHAHDIFMLGIWIPMILAACLVMMGGMLLGWRIVSGLIFGYEE